jgi:hypothetical protein
MSVPFTLAFAFDFLSGVDAPELGSADEAMANAEILDIELTRESNRQ